ncbi:MAG: PIG-L family deacetylase [Ignavibacteriaceae bacterium]|nr:PIG-L family deacetylase [Ignavibacteriaceae bacterium]
MNYVIRTIYSSITNVIKILKVIFLVSILTTYIEAQNSSTIVVITPHPDDAEASCGGFIANSVSAGDKVIILTMTGGELGIWGKDLREARLIRINEANNAAKILGAEVQFFGAIDASLFVDSSNANKLRIILSKIQPSIVLAPWPLDVHPDHQSAGILAWQVFQEKEFSFELYFYETTNTPHTKSFQFVPTNYIDITATAQKKKEAALNHKSQNPEEWFYMYEELARVRGYEADIPYAEGYIKARNSSGLGKRSNLVKTTFSH